MQTSKRRGSAFLYVIVLLVGVCVGFCSGVTGSGPDGESRPPERPAPERRPPADVGEGASVKALRARIAQLERQLAAAQAKATATPTNEVAVATQQGGPWQMRGNPREWMENLKKADPERFIQMTNRFAQFRRRRLERQQRNLDFLASVDTSHMSASAKRTHAALQKAIARREEIEEKIHQENLSDEERQKLWGQMMEAEHELRGLRRAERNNLFEATANALGFEGEDAKEIVGTLREVVESTESSWRHMGPPGGGRPNRPPQ